VEVKIPRSIAGVQRTIAPLLKSKRRLSRRKYVLLPEMEGFDTRLLEALESTEDGQRLLMAAREKEERRSQLP